MSDQKISKRKVFYICGFDPRASRYYHNLYKKESEKWSTLTGKTLEVSRRRNHGEFRCEWQVKNQDDGVDCDYSYLIWDDIIRRHWKKNPLGLIGSAVLTYLGLIRHINWSFARTLSSGPIKALLYPLFSFLLTVLATVLVAGIASLILPIFLSGVALDLVFYGVLLISVAALGYWLFIKVQSLWLLQLFIYHYQLFSGKPGAIGQRLDVFADIIVDILQKEADEYDEILLVGHSHGTVMAPILASRVAERLGGYLPEKFRLLTLGNLMPFLTGLNKESTFRNDIVRLSRSSFTWLDVSSPADGVCFALTDPFFPLCEENQADLHLLSPRFHKFYQKERYARLKKDRLTLHFQYLCCGDKLSPVNYISMTAGNKSLRSIL
ncbi:MAG: hypothetical protein ACR2PT_17300 [Endozoicomonas sp.]